MLAADGIRLGDASAILAGGMEARPTPYILQDARWELQDGKKAEDVLHADGTSAARGSAYGDHWGRCDPEFSISREEQDEFAYYSHMKAVEAIERNVQGRDSACGHKGQEKGRDSPRHRRIQGRTPRSESLSTATIFRKEGTITAESSSALCDAEAL